MYNGRVHDVTHCYNLGKKCLPPYNEVERFTNERLSTSIETIDLHRLAREVTRARFSDRLLKGK